MELYRAGAVSILLLICACPAEGPAGADSESAAGVETVNATGTTGAAMGSSGTASSAGETATTPESETALPGNESSGAASEAESSSGTAGGSSGSTGVPESGSESGSGSTGSGGGVAPLDCGSHNYACGDTIDNDGDGLIDLADPECTGPCDDDESSFQTGINGDNVDCKQDCFFDGNSGQGEGCTWDLKCDPENPGEFIGCEYNGGGPQCDNGPVGDDCLEFCVPLTPPGCDCFGCCTVQTEGGDVNIFLNGAEDCALDNLEACTECTPNEECINDCEPEMCEVCFGEIELPEGCDEANCEDTPGGACEVSGDCEALEFCLQGCCYPLPG